MVTIPTRLYRLYRVIDSYMTVVKIYNDNGNTIVVSRYEGTNTMESDIIERYLGFVPKVGDKVEIWQSRGDFGYYYTLGHTNDKYRDIEV